MIENIVIYEHIDNILEVVQFLKKIDIEKKINILENIYKILDNNFEDMIIIYQYIDNILDVVKLLEQINIERKLNILEELYKILVILQNNFFNKKLL